MRAGVDIGGTFTDLVLIDGGQAKIHKLLSSPQQPARAMLAGLEAITPGGIAALRQVAHGSTVATNAILERKGARVAFLTTAGFRDLLFIGRQDRPILYDIHPRIPPPLIQRDRCYEVPERLDFRGDVLVPLELDALDRVLDQVTEDRVDAIAVCFLFSYVNADHEKRGSSSGYSSGESWTRPGKWCCHRRYCPNSASMNARARSRWKLTYDR